MVDSYVQTPPDSTGKKLQTFQNVIGADTVEAEAVTLVDSSGAELTLVPVLINSVQALGTVLICDPDDPTHVAEVNNAGALSVTLSGSPDIEGPAVPGIYNVTMVLADTEYTQAIPLRTKKFMIHTRDESSFRFAYVTGKVATPVAPYLTVLANQCYWEDNILDISYDLFFASSAAGKVIEIVCWS